MTKRQFLGSIGASVVGAGLLTAKVEGQAKPLTRAGLVMALLRLSERATKAGLANEANEVARLAGRILKEESK